MLHLSLLYHHVAARVPCQRLSRGDYTAQSLFTVTGTPPRRGGSVRPRRTTKRVKADMERLYAYCESCPRIEELLKAYLAHASSSSRFLLLTYLQLYRVIPVSRIPRFHWRRYWVLR